MEIKSDRIPILLQSHRDAGIISCHQIFPKLQNDSGFSAAFAIKYNRHDQNEDFMQIVHVHVHVKTESIEAFRQATIENARNSVKEPGIARFDVIQSATDPAYFVLVEVYRTPQASSEHKATAHYQRWRDAVADLMAEPRSSAQFHNVFPDDHGW